MAPHWNEVILCAKLLAFFTIPYDANGIDLLYSISESHLESKSVSDIEKHLKDQWPRTSMPHYPRIANMSTAIANEFHRFRKRVDPSNALLGSFRRFTTRSAKRSVIFVLSDGLWDANDVREPISQMVEFLKGRDSTMIGVQFVHFGNDEAGWRKMEELDDFIRKP